MHGSAAMRHRNSTAKVFETLGCLDGSFSACAGG